MLIEITQKIREALYQWLGDKAKADALIERNARLGIVTIAWFDDVHYPDEFNKIGKDQPLFLFALGNISLLKREKKVAVVGARRADKRGCGVAYKLGAEYAKKGYVVVSGLAFGCDAAAHRGCLDAKGETIAIVASGLDLAHPIENKPLQDAILANGGLLISEQLLGVKANPTHLIARNRLQAALSDIVIVAQCPEHSGTMHTVRFAQKYGKKVLAVKFPYSSELNSGNDLLIETNQAAEIKF